MIFAVRLGLAKRRCGHLETAEILEKRVGQVASDGCISAIRRIRSLTASGDGGVTYGRF